MFHTADTNKTRPDSVVLSCPCRRCELGITVYYEYVCTGYSRVTGDLRASANSSGQQRRLGSSRLSSWRNPSAQHHLVPRRHTGNLCHLVVSDIVVSTDWRKTAAIF